MASPQGLGHFLLLALGWLLSPAGVRLAVRQSWHVLPPFCGQRACRKSELLTHVRVLPPHHTMPRSWRARGSWRIIFPGEQTCSSEAHVYRTRAITSSAPACPGVPSLKRGVGSEHVTQTWSHRSLGGSHGPALDLEGRGEMCT